ncbi:hypothetical protein D3C73_1395540 [compost metagenome]
MQLVLDEISADQPAVHQFLAADPNFIGGNPLNNSVYFGYDTYPGVFGCFVLHACADKRRLRQKQRNRLALHVGTH